MIVTPLTKNSGTKIFQRSPMKRSVAPMLAPVLDVLFRAGSGNVNSSSATGSVTSAQQNSTSCHDLMVPSMGTCTVVASPMEARIAPPPRSAAAPPMFAPMAQMPTARPRWLSVNVSRIKEIEPGPTTVSPAPMPMRPMNMVQ